VLVVTAALVMKIEINKVSLLYKKKTVQFNVDFFSFNMVKRKTTKKKSLSAGIGRKGNLKIF